MSTHAVSTAYLPAIDGDSPLPRGRQFYGAVSGQIEDRGLTFGELIHVAERAVPSHTHETAYYSMVIAGGYEESCRRDTVCFTPFSSAFTHSGTKHDGRIPSCGARVFTVEISDAWIQDFLRLRQEPDTVQDLAGGKLTCLGLQLYREYCTGPVASSLTVDALVWELLAVAAGLEEHQLDWPPAWWRRVLELLHSEFRRELRISEVAREVDIHPVHLARVFRRMCHQTPGEYVQRLRVRFAAERLALSGGIAQVAVDAGFADQNHLTRVFKRYTRMTPGVFRQLVASRDRKDSCHR